MFLLFLNVHLSNGQTVHKPFIENVIAAHESPIFLYEHIKYICNAKNVSKIKTIRQAHANTVLVQTQT